MKRVISLALLFLLMSGMAVYAVKSDVVTVELLSAEADSSGGYHNLSVKVSVANQNAAPLANEMVTLFLAGNEDNGVSEITNYYYQSTLYEGYIYYIEQGITDSEGKYIFNFSVKMPETIVDPADYIYAFSASGNSAAKAETSVAFPRKDVSLSISNGGSVMASGLAVADNTTLSVPTGNSLTFTFETESGYCLKEVKKDSVTVPGITDTFRTQITDTTAIEIVFEKEETVPQTVSMPNYFSDNAGTISFGQLINNNSDYELVEYGVLYSKSVTVPSLISRDVCAENCVKLQGMSKNSKGQFGIRIYDKNMELVGGSYYTRPYAVYQKEGSDVFLYGETLTIVIN